MHLNLIRSDLIDNPEKLMKPIKTKRTDQQTISSNRELRNGNKEGEQDQNAFDLYALLTESPKNNRNAKRKNY